MRKLKFSIFILLFVGIASAQEQTTIQTEVIDTAAIEEKAKEDANEDFNVDHKFTWGGGSLVTSLGGFAGAGQLPGVIIGISAPIVLAYYLQVTLPKNREIELSSKGPDYQSVYRPTYQKIIRIQRIKSTMF